MAVAFDEAIVECCRQLMVQNARTVELAGKRYPVRKTSRKHLRQVDFVFGGEELRGLEQNPETKSRWAKMARSGKKVMQFLAAGRYVAVVVDAKPIFYSGLGSKKRRK